jgi:hypothetical protein
MNKSSFIQNSWVGNKILIDAAIALCNYSLYSNGLKDPFIDDGFGNFVPALGPLRFFEDHLKSDVLTIPVDISGGNHFVENDITFNGSLDSFEYMHAFGVVTTLKLYTLVTSGNIRVTWKDDLGATKGVSSQAFIPVLGQTYAIRVETTPTSLVIMVDGFGIPDVSIAAGACTIDVGTLAGNLIGGFEPSADIGYINTSFMGDTSLIGRLPTQLEPSVTSYTSTTGIVWTVVDDGTPPEQYPYIGQHPAVYLVSDNPCPDNNIQIIDDIAQMIDGEWQFIP